MTNEKLHSWFTSKMGRHTPIYVWLLLNLILGIISGLAPLHIALIIVIWSVGYLLALKMEQIKTESVRPKVTK